MNNSDTPFNIKIYHECPDWWDSLVSEHGGFFCSSSKWDLLWQSLCIGKARYLEVSENNKPVLLVLFYDILIGSTYMVQIPSVILRILRMIPYMNGFSLHLQPVIVDTSLENDEVKKLAISKEVITYLTNLAVLEKKSILPSDFILFKDINYAKSLKETNPSTLLMVGTSRLLLEKDVDLQYKNFSESVKSGVRKCQRLNVEVKTVTGKDLKKYYNGLYTGWKSHKLAVVPYSYYCKLAELFPEFVRFFIAELNGEVLAGSGVLYFGTSVYEFSMYASPKSYELKIPAGDLLKWEIIKYSIENGYKVFDLNMIAVDEDTSEKTKNINFYKMKWGGDSIYGVKLFKLPEFLYLIRRLKHAFLGK